MFRVVYLPPGTFPCAPVMVSFILIGCCVEWRQPLCSKGRRLRDTRGTRIAVHQGMESLVLVLE